MEFYFSNEFIYEFKKIVKAKEHHELETIFIEQIFKKTFEQILKIGTYKQSGDLKNSVYIKKRISKQTSGKRGGYRAYITVLIKNEKLYFIFIHPKTGRRSMVKLETKKERELLKQLQKDKKENNLIQVTINKKQTKIIDLKTKKDIF